MRFTQVSHLRTMTPVIMSVAMFSLLLLLIDVVQCSIMAFEVHSDMKEYKDEINHVKKKLNQLSQQDERYISMDKPHLLEQISAQMSMTQPIIEELTKLYEAKFGDITKWPGSSKEFDDPDDQAQAQKLMDKFAESRAWFSNLDWLLARRLELKKVYGRVEANVKRIQEVEKSIANLPKMVRQQSYLDYLNHQLRMVKQTLDKFRLKLAFQFGALKASNVVDQKLSSSSLYSDYRTVKDVALERLTEQCERLYDKLDELEMEELLEQNPPVTGNSEEQEKPEDFPENQDELPIPPKPNHRPFWKKRGFYIPAGLATFFGGWMLDLHNKIPKMIGWGSKEDDATTIEVNPPNSTTTDTSTDEPTHQVEYLTEVIIILVILVLLVVGFVIFLVKCKNGTSDLEHGQAFHKSHATKTNKVTETPLTPTSTRRTNATSNKAKKNSPGAASTSVSTKTKSKRPSQK